MNNDDALKQNITWLCHNQIDHMINSYPNVVGFGNGHKFTNDQVTDIPCITYFVNKKIPLDQLPQSALIPQNIRGIRTDVIEVGDLKTQDIILKSSNNNQDFYASASDLITRPVSGGVSCAVVDLQGAGTLGCAVIDDTNVYILSNNHVLANVNRSKLGAEIYQPAFLEGGSFTNPIATLFSFKTIEFRRSKAYPENRIDAAIGLIGKRNDSFVTQTIQGGITNIGLIKGINTSVFLGQTVRKMGRTTGLTSGTVTAVNSNIVVSYNNKESALFTNQIVTTAMSKPGDSGSVGVDDNNRAFGLLFAGSLNATIYNPISFVLGAFNISIL